MEIDLIANPETCTGKFLILFNILYAKKITLKKFNLEIR